MHHYFDIFLLVFFLSLSWPVAWSLRIGNCHLTCRSGSGRADHADHQQL
jgi:hypothetical protein